MANARNVAALEALLRKELPYPLGAAGALAHFLASHGVLVPNAMADDDTLADVLALSNDSEGCVFPAVLRDCLEALAKGEPLPERGYATREEKQAAIDDWMQGSTRGEEG